jgi:Gnt-I system high-affinity gluconate transporter
MPLLIVALGVLLLLVLILLKIKPVYALPIVSLVVGVGQGMGWFSVLQSIGLGIWDTLKSIALVLFLGAMFGKMIEKSGAAGRISTSLINFFGKANIQWAVMLTGFVVGIPMFYNAGFVILIPLVFSIALSAEIPILLVGIPMAASLSVTHGFLPPHPGPTAIASIFQADLGKTLLLGFVVAIPTVILAGPIFSRTLSKMKVALSTKENIQKTTLKVLPSQSLSFFVALLPVLLIGLSALLAMFTRNKPLLTFVDFFGGPLVALSISLVLSILTFRKTMGSQLNDIATDLFQSIKDVALIVLVIAAGGGFKQVLIDSGVGVYIKSLAEGFSLSPLLLAWSVAALLRVSLGSATVAGLTAAGIVLPFLSQPGVHPELMVLAVGAGSLMFSHVNDTGFWMFKEYFNLTLKQTFQSWTMMETIVSISGLLGVLLLDQII